MNNVFSYILIKKFGQISHVVFKKKKNRLTPTYSNSEKWRHQAEAVGSYGTLRPGARNILALPVNKNYKVCSEK